MHGAVHAREVGHLWLAEVSGRGGAGGAKSVVRLEVLVVEDVDFMHGRLGHLVQHKGAGTADADDGDVLQAQALAGPHEFSSYAAGIRVSEGGDLCRQADFPQSLLQAGVQERV